MRLLRPMVMTLVMGSFLVSLAGATEQTVESRIEKVVVYPDRAKISREATLTLEAGTHTVSLENLPGSAFEESIRAAASGLVGMTFLGLTHTTEQHLETPAEKVAELRQKLNRLVREEQQVASDRLATFEELKEFIASLSASARVEMQREVTEGRINVDQWLAAYDFLGDKSFSLADSIRSARTVLADVTLRVKLMREKLSSLQVSHARTTRTVSIDLELTEPGEVSINLDYIVPGASWRPIYDARLGEKPGEVEFTYYAEVSQKTGEDWEDVNLTLSTALPSVGAGPGELAPWFLHRHGLSPVQSAAGGTGEIRGRLVDQYTGKPVVGAAILIAGTQSGAMTDPHGYFRIARVAPGFYTLRISHLNFCTVEVTDVIVTAGETQIVSQEMTPKATDLDATITVMGRTDILDKFQVDNLLEQVTGVQTTAPGEVFIRGSRAGEVAYIVDGVPIGEPYGGRGNNMALVSGTVINSGSYPAVFRIKRPETITSGAEETRVTVAQWEFKGEAKLISRPRNREGAYRLVTVTNQDAVPLTPSRIAIFVGTHYLGNTEFTRLIAPGEQFELAFGLDNHITVKRQVSAFKQSSRGKNRRLEQTIELTVANLADEVRVVEIQENIPVSRDNRVKVKIRDIVPAPTTQDDYGRLTWSITLPPNSDTVLTVPYRIEHPADMKVVGL